MCFVYFILFFLLISFMLALPILSFVGFVFCSGINSEDVTQHQEEAKGPVLRSTIHGRRTLIKHGSDEADSQPQVKKKKIDLIFKDVVEASLEASQCQNNPLNSTLSLPRPRAQVSSVFSQSGTFSANVVETMLGQAERKVPHVACGLVPVKQLESSLERYVKVEDAQEEPKMISEGPSTSFCPNCVRLKRRIRELEAELLHFKQQEQTETLCLPPSESLPSDDLRGRFTHGRQLCRGIVMLYWITADNLLIRDVRMLILFLFLSILYHCKPLIDVLNIWRKEPKPLSDYLCLINDMPWCAFEIGRVLTLN